MARNKIKSSQVANGAEANTASNLGAGSSIFAQKSGVDLQFKSLVAGSNITLSSDSSTVTIAASGGGAVSSVAGRTGAVVLAGGDVSNAPAGNIAATTIQAAINELDTEKLSLAGGTLTGKLTTVGATTGASSINIPQGTKPTTPNNGDIWVDATGLFVQTNGNTQQLDYASNTVGCIALPTITPAGSGATIDVSSVDAYLYSSSGWTGSYGRYTVPAATGLALSEGINYLVVNYNSGSPVFQTQTSTTGINSSNVAFAAMVTREGTIVHPVPVDWGKATAIRHNDQTVTATRFQRVSGLTITETTGRVVNVSSGAVYYGVTPISVASTDTTTTAAAFYYPVGGTWTRSTVGVYNNTQYRNGNDLATLSNGRYGVNWIYRSVDGTANNLLSIVLGEGNYTLAEAKASTVPIVPPVLPAYSILVGRIIVLKNASTATQIDSAFTQTFAGSAATDHNSLANLQGGTSDDYQHLTTAQLASISGLNHTFGPREALQPATSYPTLNLRNNIAVLEFSQSSAQTVQFVSSANPIYGGGTITVNIFWTSTATSGNVPWGVRFARILEDVDNLDTDSYASQKTVTTTVGGTSGLIKKSTITFTQAEADSIAAGNPFKLELQRVSSGDTMAANAQFLRLTIT